MPELAEVEYYRKRWNPGLGERVTGVHLHGQKRIFRAPDVELMRKSLSGSRLLRSEARGKQLLFQFSKDLWLGLHLGMTGQLLTADPDFEPGPHDHLTIFQAKQSLVLRDPRLFGRVRFDHSSQVPAWWASLPVPVNSAEFKRASMERFLERHPKLAVKSALLLQAGFSGIGNWMADEILWRAKVDPRRVVRQLEAHERAALWKALRLVCRGALKHVSHDFSDPPTGWLFHERWGRGGVCPLDATPLQRATVGGRTSAWCPTCQPSRSHPAIDIRVNSGK